MAVREGETVECAVQLAGDRGPHADPGVGFRTVYQDEILAVVDKPAGVVVHRGAGWKSATLVDGLLARFPGLEELWRQGALDPVRPGIVHRLDRETSGLMVVGLTPEAVDCLSDQIRRREVKRSYLALVAGILTEDEGVVEAPVGRLKGRRRDMGVLASGRPAVTRYEVLQRLGAGLDRFDAGLTLLEVHLETGRTHQIRVHTSAIGHPVAGDVRYGGPTFEAAGLRTDAVAAGTVGSAGGPGFGGQPAPVARIFLHAHRLSLAHPVTGEVMEWGSPLPPELAGALAAAGAALAGGHQPGGGSGSQERPSNESPFSRSTAVKTSHSAGSTSTTIRW